ncbi:1-deoxy-D-xylulose-5-phosphate synthase [Dissostichus eleginoides]|nr:1-deoxy-D-xylulose-5-phosphate synthase [Dissostichus eleginoides]
MSDEGDKWSVEASGLYAHMTRMSFITCVIVFEDILRVIHVTHKALQSSSCTLSEAAALTDNLKAHFKSQRQADTWSNMWGSVKQFCRDNNVPVPGDADVECQTPGPLAPKRKRATKPPTSLDSFLVTTTLGQRETDESGAQRSQSDTAGFQQHLYLPVLDTLINELDRRFTGESIDLARACAAVFKCDKNGI